ncbi:hypothetical protein EJ06DRAFT_551391 [Trichodelitschia bisporula]|uniref:Uncharacterized protein n=1 Tax=Trichodelitschia bisporula TaxID=703511 RepID=A0A6G1HLI9_9PEZI|nr:hypothetical protein EJ06DRAFT_551391 [Trichodelitschia bisporula]
MGWNSGRGLSIVGILDKGGYIGLADSEPNPPSYLRALSKTKTRVQKPLSGNPSFIRLRERLSKCRFRRTPRSSHVPVEVAGKPGVTLFGASKLQAQSLVLTEEMSALMQESLVGQQLLEKAERHVENRKAELFKKEQKIVLRMRRLSSHLTDLRNLGDEDDEDDGDDVDDVPTTKDAIRQAEREYVDLVKEENKLTQWLLTLHEEQVKREAALGAAITSRM